MRHYTTLSLAAALSTFAVLVVVVTSDLYLQLVGAGVSTLVVALAFFWERRPPTWLAAAAVFASGALWCIHIAAQGSQVIGMLFAVAVIVPITHTRANRPWWMLAGLCAVLGPVLAAAVAEPNGIWIPWLTVGAGSYASAALLFILNSYGWGLYLEIDGLRRSSANLAVAQERYRFATDLHDIQGHTLHVIRLKTRLAARLLERDPAAARVQLEEADDLIGDTLANTRSLAFGDRHVALASELANARELLQAAGIKWMVAGASTPSVHDELFGLVMREATTNILRHSQATEVSVTLAAGRLTIVNNGSPESMRAQSGLARLGERVEAAGGSLRTSIRDSRFTTEASIP
jgi:two-component system sensor histidine kinase DesK